MVVRSNINSMNASRNLNKNNNQVSKAIEKLSSGYAINKAADDAAGLAITEKMRSQITGLDQGTSNCLDGVCLVQVAEGALNEMHSMLNRVVELAAQSSNGTYMDEVDREAIQAEVDVLLNEIDRIAQATNYNGIDLLTGMTPSTYLYTDYYDGTTDNAIVTGYLNVISGVSSTSTYHSSSYYQSDAVDLANGSLSVPASADLPYEIKMEIVSYDENSGEGSGSNIYNTTISLVVDIVDGELSVKGYNNGNLVADYATKPNYTTNYDIANGLPGYDYVSCTTADYINGTKSSIVTESEMKYIMEDLLNSMDLDLEAGGYTGLSYPSYGSYYDNDGNGNSLYAKPTDPYPTYPDGTSTTDYVPGDSYYTLSSSVPSDGTVYSDPIYIFGPETYTNNGRVLGVVSTVTSGGNLIDTVESPNNFVTSDWYSGKDINNLDDDLILGITKVGESDRSETKIPIPISNTDFNNATADMTDEERAIYIAGLVVVVEMITPIYPEYPEDFIDEEKYNTSGFDAEDVTVTTTKKFVTVTHDFVDDNPSMFGEDVIIVRGDLGDEEHEIIDKLSESISSNFSGIRANRKLDDVKYDITTDYNEFDKYTLQLGTYDQDKTYWTKEPIVDPIYEYTHSPIIIHAADENATYNKIYIDVDDMRIEAMGLSGLSVSTQESAGFALDYVNNAINYVSTNRANLGAYQNRLEYTINNNNNTSENMNSAKSVIKDCDMAKEMMNYTTQNVLTNAAQSMLVQSNESLQQILSLLG